MSSIEPDASPLLQCAIHGPQQGAVVCRHLLGPSDHVLGFVENSDDPDDLQAWCDGCERFFVAEGELTEAFREFNEFAVVCAGCYADIKARHSRLQSPTSA